MLPFIFCRWPAIQKSRMIILSSSKTDSNAEEQKITAALDTIYGNKKIGKAG